MFVANNMSEGVSKGGITFDNSKVIHKIPKSLKYFQLYNYIIIITIIQHEIPI